MKTTPFAVLTLLRIALLFTVSCGLPSFAVFDERRPVAIDEQFGLLESESGAVQSDTLPGGVRYRSLPVRLVRRDTSLHWEDVAQKMVLIRILGEIRLEDSTRGPRPLFAIGAERQGDRPAHSLRSAAAQVQSGVRVERTREESIRMLRELELQNLDRGDEHEVERDFLLVCIVEIPIDSGCWTPGERYLLRITPARGGTLELPLWIERRDIALSLTLGVLGIVFFLVVSTT